jgi:hypothetical protein
VAYTPQVLIQTPSGPVLAVGSGFFGGQGRILVNNPNPGSPFNVTPADLANFKVGPANCADGVVKGMTLLPYDITAADVAAGSITLTFVYAQGHSLLGDCTLEVQAGSQFTTTIVALPSCVIAPASQEVCAGGSATFTASSTGPPAGAPHTFAWTGPGGFTATGPSITVTVGGTYTATIMDQFGCTSTCTAQLVVNPNPECAIAPTTRELCASGSASFTVNITGGTGPFIINWTGPAGFSATGPSITIPNAQEINEGVYTANVTDAKGCVTSCNAALVVNPNPTCVVSPATQTTCVGGSATFTVTVTGGTSPFTITWSGPSGFTASGPTATVNNAQTANAGTYTASVVDAKGCSTSCQAALVVEACVPDVEVTKEVACFLGNGQCGTFGKVATGVSTPPDCPAFCYRITVRNADDDVDITQLTVNDTSFGNLSAQFASALPLVPGESVSIELAAHEVCSDTRNTVTVEGRSAQGLADVDTDFADVRVLRIAAQCVFTLFSSLDQDGQPNDNSVSLPEGSVDVPIAFHITLRNTGNAAIRVTQLDTALPHGLTLPIVLAVNETRNIDGEVLVSCPGASFSFRALADADDSGGAFCVFNDQGQRAATATEVCPATVTCLVAPAITCRTTGGGVLLPGTSDESCITVETTIFPLTSPSGLTIKKITHGGQTGAPFSQEDCGEILGNPCIRGNWSHQRHWEGTGNPRDIIDANFHTASPKSPFDSLMCACLGCCDPETGAFITPIVVGELCNPDDHKVCGPQPRPAPANAIIMSGIGRLTPEDDIRGPRADRTEYVVFRIYIEDRSEPGGFHPNGAVEPADIYCFQAWRTGIKASKKPDFSTVSPDFRRALGAANCAFLRDLQNGVKPIGSLPDPEVAGVMADIVDCGPLSTGNHQIHPSTGATCE